MGKSVKGEGSGRICIWARQNYRGLGSGRGPKRYQVQVWAPSGELLQSPPMLDSPHVRSRPTRNRNPQRRRKIIGFIGKSSENHRNLIGQIP
eukprot:8238521-Pyramimonas_sp.AAC.1